MRSILIVGLLIATVAFIGACSITGFRTSLEHGELLTSGSNTPPFMSLIPK